MFAIMKKQGKKKCAVEHCNSYFLWGKGLCSYHYKLEYPSKSIKKYSKKGLENKKAKTERTKERHLWFQQLFDKQKDSNGYCYCYETGKPMHESVYKMNSCIYSHCYPKSSYPQYEFNEDNVLIVLPDIHNQWGIDSSKTPKMLEYFNKLKEKYE
jgi:hypothetical protein